MKQFSVFLFLLMFLYCASLPAQSISHVNESGNLIVEDEAFLPLGFYAEYIHLPSYPSLIQDMVDGGFNTLVTETYAIDTNVYKTFLNNCYSQSLKNIVVLPKYTEDPIRFTNYVNALKPYPSLISWNLLFNANYFELELIELQKQQLQNLDESRVTTADFELITPPFQYMLDHIETSCFSQSPWGYPWGTPPPDLDLAAYRFRFHALEAASKGIFPMIVAQTFNWEGNDWPSPEHLDCQTYLGYVTGNKGVLFYAFPDPDNNSTINISQPELYAATTNIAGEILQSEWKDVILHGEHDYHNIYQYKHYATWRYNNAFYVIAINASGDNSFNFEIPIPEDVTGEAINFFEARPNSLSRENDMLTGDLAPYQVAIYKIESLAPTAIISLESKTKLRLYPNPTTGHVKLSAAEPITHYEVFNTQGNRVFFGNNSLENTTVDLGFLPPGLYYIKAQSQNNTSYSAAKIIIQ